MEERWSKRAENLPFDHPGCELEARYIALAAANLACILSPQRIILGGGLLNHPRLFRMVQKQTREILNGYIASPQTTEHIVEHIVLPELGSRPRVGRDCAGSTKVTIAGCCVYWKILGPILLLTMFACGA